jgi:hypothetical protein
VYALEDNTSIRATSGNFLNHVYADVKMRHDAMTEFCVSCFFANFFRHTFIHALTNKRCGKIVKGSIFILITFFFSKNGHRKVMKTLHQNGLFQKKFVMSYRNLRTLP